MVTRILRIAVVVASLIAPASSWGEAATAGEELGLTARIKGHLERKEYDKALEELKSAHELFPYQDQLRLDLAALYSLIAQRDLKTSRYQHAAEYFGQARELDPDNPRYGLMRGVALYLAKEFDAAKAELNQAPEGGEQLYYLGRISYDSGDLPTAIAYWRRARELEPKNEIIRASIEKAERELPVEGKMDKGYSSMFDLTYDAELPPGLAADVLDTLERAYSSVGADLGRFPSKRIPVVLYTKADYSSVTAGPDWSGGLYDGKIRLPVGGVSKVTAPMRAVLFHEYTHVVIAEITGGNIPTWLNEGLADIQGRKEFAHAGAPSPQGPSAEPLSLKTLSGSFTSMSRANAAQAYEQSYSIASFIVNRYGWYAVQGILKELANRASLEVAVAKALADSSQDLPGVMREWEESRKGGEGR